LEAAQCAIEQGGVELGDVLRYTGIHDRKGPQRSGLFGAVSAAGATHAASE
jgi:hypothetical protein